VKALQTQPRSVPPAVVARQNRTPIRSWALIGCAHAGQPGASGTPAWAASGASTAAGASLANGEVVADGDAVMALA
jgi:hypothetical protein